MKLQISILALILFCSSNAQEIKDYKTIKYQVSFSNSTHIIAQSILYFNDSVSFYVPSYKTKLEVNNNKKEVDLNLRCKNWIKTQTNRNELWIQSNIAHDSYLVLDNTIDHKWILMEDQKLIGNLLCHKAMTEFRGRKYIAWFTHYKEKVGPWKFHGLPGIILHLYEADFYVSYEAVSIDLKKNKNKRTFKSCGEKLDIKAFVSIKEEIEVSKYLEILKSRLPKGARIESGKKLNRFDSNVQELIFEWETQNEKK